MNKLLASFNLPWYALPWKKYLNSKYLLFGGKKKSCLLRREGRHRFKSNKVFDLLADLFFFLPEICSMVWTNLLLYSFKYEYSIYAVYLLLEEGVQEKKQSWGFGCCMLESNPVLDVELLRKLNSFCINIILPYLNFDITKRVLYVLKVLLFSFIFILEQSGFVTLMFQINCFCMILLEDWGFAMQKFWEIFLAISVSC